MADPTTLTIQTVTSAGVELTFTDADTTNGNRWLNTGKQYLEIVNTGASSAVVTVISQLTMDSLAVADREITVAPGERFHGIFARTDIYNDSSGYTVLTVSGDGAADIKYAVFA